MSNIILNLQLSETNILQIKINKNKTIGTLKEEIKQLYDINVNQQVLIFGGNVLENKNYLNFYNISNNSTLILLIEEKKEKNTEKYEIKKKVTQTLQKIIPSDEKMEKICKSPWKMIHFCFKAFDNMIDDE